MKKTKILAPALGILCLSMAASITGTVAWFSTNANVTAQGMQMTAETATNLFIKNGTYDKTTGSFIDHPVAESEFTALGSEGQKVDNIMDTDEYLEGETLPEGKAVGESKNSPLKPVSTTDSFENWVYVQNSALVKTGGQIFENTAEITAINANKGTGADVLAMKSLDDSADAVVSELNGFCVTGCVYLFLQSAVNNKISVNVTVEPTTEARAALLPAVRVGLKFKNVTTTTDTTNGGFVDTIFSSAAPDYYPCTNASTVSEAKQVTQPFGTAYYVAPGTASDPTSGMMKMESIQCLIFFWFEGQDGACVNSNSLKSDGYILKLAFGAAQLA